MLQCGNKVGEVPYSVQHPPLGGSPAKAKNLRGDRC